MSFLDKITKIFKPEEEQKLESEVPNKVQIPNSEIEPEVEIISTSASGYGSIRTVINFDSTVNNVKQAVLNYRNMSLFPEVDAAIQEITNEAMVIDTRTVVSLEVLDDEITKSIADKIKDEFNGIVRMMDFNRIGDEIFRQWYEDGRLYLHGVIDLKKTKSGIQDIKVLSPLTLKRIKEDGIYFYIYEDKNANNALKIPTDHITFCPSGLTTPDKKLYISYLHKAFKPFNQLKMLEDAAVIYRITRAPERRVFYVDVGQMNKSKAESYMAGIISKFKNKITYDSNTGEVNQQKNSMTMTEDFWLPSSESGSGSRGTKIDTLPAGQTLGELTDIEYFKRKLLKSLRVPYSRFDQEQPSMMGFGNMQGEMSRDEVRFAKFIHKLRSKFGLIFFDLLKKQCIFKNIITAEDWVNWKDFFVLNWATDSYFAEVRESEILKNRAELAEVIEPYIGKYFSNEYVLKNVFKMTDDEIEEEKKRIEDEEKSGEIKDDEDIDDEE